MSSTAPQYPGRTKYTDTAAEKYQHRPPKKDEAEKKLVEKALAGIAPGTALDAPCGGGRMALLLQSKGFRVTAGDLSPAMLAIARERGEPLGITVVSADVEKLAFKDREFDLVLCFRLFQHFPSVDIRRRVVAELCRVSRSHVLLSYFTPWSFTALKRSVQTMLGKRRTKYHNSLQEIRSYFEAAGFEFVSDHAQKRGIHALHLAVFRRKSQQ